ncbi:uncharacterized protein LOC133876724 [Alnus glutinosa]|uniref:uncharacterized protein LOC133876724 n=1 Tax=Alnus glutinosa TaxID=3517 RepID=UPI002D77D4CB|nr:uncharacterized protein LOC133876724 [Alnus glutinosa]
MMKGLTQKNQGNFIELIKLLATYNDDVSGLVLENAKYTSPKIQKEILHIIANKVRDMIRKEIGDAKFCILVDEARDESKREQMAIILSTLKKNICAVLSRYNLQIENIRDQGYDGALVAASREAKHIHQFFIQLASIINIVGGSSKRHDELQAAQVAEIESLIVSNKIETENDIDIPDRNAHYSRAPGQSHRQDEGSLTTVKHHFRVNIFTAAIDFQLQELKSRFGEQAVELLTLSVALRPKDAYKSFEIDDICKLAEKFYPKDFNVQERFCLKFQLEHYKLDVPKHSNFQNMSTLSELCIGLANSEKSKIYPLIDRLIHLVLTLPVSTATTERAFSAMKLIKTRLRSRMEDEFLAYHMVVYIEKEIAKNFISEMVMDEFYSISDHRRA